MNKFSYAGKIYQVINEYQNLEESKNACRQLDSEVARLSQNEFLQIKDILDSKFIQEIKYFDKTGSCYNVYFNDGFSEGSQNVCDNSLMRSKTLCSSKIEETTTERLSTTTILMNNNSTETWMIVAVCGAIVFLYIAICIFVHCQRRRRNNGRTDEVI